MTDCIIVWDSVLRILENSHRLKRISLCFYLFILVVVVVGAVQTVQNFVILFVTWDIYPMSIPKKLILGMVYPKTKKCFGILGLKVLNRHLFKSRIVLNSLNNQVKSFEQLQLLLQSFEQLDPL